MQHAAYNMLFDTITHLQQCLIDIVYGIVYIVHSHHRTFNEDKDMSTEEQRVRARDKKRRQRLNRRKGFPDFYKPEGERLMAMQTRVDARKVASLHHYFRQRHNKVIRERSELIRCIVDLLYLGAMEDETFREFLYHEDAYDYLLQYGCAPEEDTRDGQSFVNTTIASEAYDIEYHGVKDVRKQEYFEGIKEALDFQDKTPEDVERTMRPGVEEKGYDWKDFLTYFYGHGNGVPEPAQNREQKTALGSRQKEERIVNTGVQTADSIDSDEGIPEHVLKARRAQQDKEQLDQMKNALSKPPVPRGKE